MDNPVHAAMIEDLGSVLEVTALAFEFLILLVEDDVLVFSPPSLLSSFVLMSSCLSLLFVLFFPLQKHRGSQRVHEYKSFLLESGLLESNHDRILR